MRSIIRVRGAKNVSDVRVYCIYYRIYPPQVHHSPSLADSGNYDDINCSLAHTLEKDLEKLHQNYEEMREKHNEKVEELLKIIADSNDK